MGKMINEPVTMTVKKENKMSSNQENYSKYTSPFVLIILAITIVQLIVNVTSYMAIV